MKLQEIAGRNDVSLIFISPAVSGMGYWELQAAQAKMVTHLRANGEKPALCYGQYKDKQEVSYIYSPALQIDAVEFAISVARSFNQESIMVMLEDRRSYLVYTGKGKPKFIGFMNSLTYKPRTDYTEYRHKYYCVRKRRYPNWKGI